MIGYTGRGGGGARVGHAAIGKAANMVSEGDNMFDRGHPGLWANNAGDPIGVK